MRNILLAMPPVGEQEDIARFVDSELAKLDSLVAEQQRLIELMNEKRQAVISRAVTRGLNPDAPMKPSGVEWPGDVPAHWHVQLLKRFCETITDGAHVSPETEYGTLPFISTRDVRDEGIDFDNCLLTSTESYANLVRYGCRPLPGDVLFSKDGTIGRTVVVETDRDFVVASSLIILTPTSNEIDPWFLHYLCQSSALAQQFDRFVKGAGLPRLSIQNLRRVVAVAPPLLEQRAIQQHLRGLDAVHTGRKQEAERAIALLQERRAALISAAVTGKIDVRGLVDVDAA
jgi:type I restriction enzyme, S subunit